MNNSFLHNTACSIVEQIAWNQLNKTTLVVPSHRAGLVLKNELMHLQKEQGQQAVWAPDVKTLQQLQDTLSPLYSEDELLTIVRLYKLYLNNQNNLINPNDLMPLDLFYGWGRQMIADFTNVDASMHADKVPNFFENTIAAHELEEWKLDPETEERLRALMNPNSPEAASIASDSIRHRYESVWRQLYELYQGLRAEMATEQKGYAGMRQRAVIEQWNSEYVQSRIAGRTYIFVGFNYLLPVEFELMQLLKENGQALFYWDFIPDFAPNTKAFSFAQKNAGLLGNSNPLTPNSLTPNDVTIVSCSSSEAQAQYVHRWLLENYTAHGQNVGVVICDETMLEPVIYTLPAITLPGETSAEPINITKGFPLRNTAIYARVIAWLYDKARGDAEQTVSPDFIDDLLKLLSEKSESSESSDSSDSLTWQELLILESEYQVRKIANQMRLILANGLGSIPFTLKLLRLLMRRKMEDVSMPFHGEPVTDIQVMGVLETRLMDFDKLLILNVEEGVVPQTQTDSSFIPFYLRKAYHMQTPDERATVYAYNFFRLLSHAGETTMLFSSAEDVETSKGMSRFLMQIMVSPQYFNVRKLRLQEPSIVPDADDARLGTSGVSLASLLEPDENGVLRYKSTKELFSLSPSAMNTYITCPRQFCLQYIQGRRGEEKKEAEFSPAEIGTFVHEAMRHFYTTYFLNPKGKDAVLLPDEIDAISDDTHLQEALTVAYEKINRKWTKHHPDEPSPYVREMHLSENEVILGFIRNILDRDRQDAAVGLKISLLEEPMYFNVPVQDIGIVRTGGIIDRLDLYGTDDTCTMRVVDYKSGRYKQDSLTATAATWFDSPEKSYIRQTLVYSHAVLENKQPEMPIEPNLFFCSRKLAGMSTTVSFEKNAVTDYKDIKDSFFEALQLKMHEILTATEFPPCEDGKCKSYCPFLGVCRRKPKTEY